MFSTGLRYAMPCSLQIKRSAAKALAALSKSDRTRLVGAIDLLCDTPAAGSDLKVNSRVVPLAAVSYRIVYK
jgi:hypothetical protein